LQAETNVKFLLCCQCLLCHYILVKYFHSLVGFSNTTEGNGLKLNSLIWKYNRSLSKAYNKNMDFDRNMALFELKIFYIIHALVLLLSTENSWACCPTDRFW
jgi:hypothetical protein